MLRCGPLQSIPDQLLSQPLPPQFRWDKGVVKIDYRGRVGGCGCEVIVEPRLLALPLDYKTLFNRSMVYGCCTQIALSLELIQVYPSLHIDMKDCHVAGILQIKELHFALQWGNKPTLSRKKRSLKRVLIICKPGNFLSRGDSIRNLALKQMEPGWL